MLAACPYPDCRSVFRIDGAIKVAKVGACPSCGRQGSIYATKIWRQTLANEIVTRSRVGQLQCQTSFVQISAILENIRSLFNVGSIFRSADAVGIGKLYLTGITGCPPRKEICKASLGAENYVPWQYLAHPLHIIPALKSEDITLLGLEKTKSSLPLPDLLAGGKLHKPLCFVVGNEVDGISPELLSQCDAVCHLPMKGWKESLNVAVAFGAAAYLLDLLL